VGILVAASHANPSVVVSMVRDLSRTAWRYASRVAWYDELTGRTCELTSTDLA
jgi:hypothetical protein